MVMSSKSSLPSSPSSPQSPSSSSSSIPSPSSQGRTKSRKDSSRNILSFCSSLLFSFCSIFSSFFFHTCTNTQQQQQQQQRNRNIKKINKQRNVIWNTKWISIMGITIFVIASLIYTTYLPTTTSSMDWSSSSISTTTTLTNMMKIGQYQYQYQQYADIDVNIDDDDLTNNNDNDNNDNNDNNEESTSNNNNNNNNETKTPMNILLLYADDWTMKVMGKLNKYVYTPNIDQMADQGILFTKNAVTTSLCWVSRGSLVTGTYASRHLFVNLSDDILFYSHPWNQTLFPLLKQHGYYTGIVGKWHAAQPEPEMSMAFDYQNLYYGAHWELRNGVQRHVTDLNLEDSLHFLQNKRPQNQQPFALLVSFFATHAWDGHEPAYEPTNETKARYYTNNNNNNNHHDDNEYMIPTPETWDESYWQQMPFFFTEYNEGRVRWRGRFDRRNYQRNIKDLYRMAAEVDTAVGEIIKVLKQQGVYNNTLLIFTTDNGNMHGDHGLAEKWYPYEESIHVPLVIVDPRMDTSHIGTQNDEFTLNIDLAPTILRAANIPIPSFMQGRDISSMYKLPLKDQQTQKKKNIDNRNDKTHRKWRKDWFYEYNQGNATTGKDHPGKEWIDASFALVTKNWKYIYWPQHDYEQIFHLKNDPYETTDLFQSNQTLPDSVLYQKLRRRYEQLKHRAQSGHRV